MSQTNRSFRALAGATIAAGLVLSACRSANSSEPVETVIAVSAFETLGDAQPTVAQDMAANLAAALNADSHIKAQTETGVSRPSRDYILKGSVYSDGPRAFVALQLLDAKTTNRVWSENYDYRGIGADQMAADIRAHLQTHATTTERDRR
jgi:TolB-like protein